MPASRAARVLDLSGDEGDAVALLGPRHPAWSWVRSADASAPGSGGAPFDAAIVGSAPASSGNCAPLLSGVFGSLRPGGLALVNVPAHRWLASEADSPRGIRRRFGAAELRAELSAAGFRGIQSTHWNSLALPLLWARLRLSRPPRNAAPFGSSRAAAVPLAALGAVESAWIRMGGRWPAGQHLLAVARRPLVSDFA